jgi:hypothetical protein
MYSGRIEQTRSSKDEVQRTWFSTGDNVKKLKGIEVNKPSDV